jgi:hypothetical protein
MKKAFIEAIKEFFRTGILGGLSSATGVAILGLNTTTGEIHINYALMFVVLLFNLLTAFMRAVDKFIHEWDGTKLKGIMPF